MIALPVFDKKLKLALFVALSILQLAIISSMITNYSTTLKKGTPYKFRTAPVDPYDAFRGRFVQLAFAERQVASPEGQTLKHGDRVYAQVEEHEDGFARITVIYTSRPKSENYFETRVQYVNNGSVTLQLPFDRYYMNEELAKKAETVYREHTRGGKRDAYATVRIRKGKAQLEELFIAEKPVHQFLEDEALKEPKAP